MQAARIHHGSRTSRRSRLAGALYLGLLLLCAVVLAYTGASASAHQLIAIAVLTVISTCGQLASHRIRTRVSRHFDMDLGVVLVAVVLAGPLAGVIVATIPELIVLARRRQAPWRPWAMANWVSFAATALAGAAVLRALPHTAVWQVPALLAAGAAMLLANYLFARMIFAIVRDGASPATLLRSEFLPVLPLAAAAVTIGVVSVLLLPDVGVLALAGFAALVYLPQLAVLRLLRAPSVARLSVEDAARVYREALSDELGFVRRDRQLVHLVDALAESRPLPYGADNPFAAAQDALLVTVCTSRAPTQRHYSASPRAQVVLVARHWSRLTARATPALSHHEALRELQRTDLTADAPLALSAAAAIIDREHQLTEHVTGVPRLHRLPLPRRLRQDLLPPLLARLIVGSGARG